MAAEIGVQVSAGNVTRRQHIVIPHATCLPNGTFNIFRHRTWIRHIVAFIIRRTSLGSTLARLTCLECQSGSHPVPATTPNRTSPRRQATDGPQPIESRHGRGLVIRRSRIASRCSSVQARFTSPQIQQIRQHHQAAPYEPNVAKKPERTSAQGA